MRRAVVAIAGVVVVAFLACKTRGTIDLSFDNAIPCDAPPQDGHPADAGIDAATDAGEPEYVLIYAKDETRCSDCTCGACFGAPTDDTSACASATDRCTLTSIRDGIELGLSPGKWAVVLDRYHVADDRLFASRCIDVVVDSDGTANKNADLASCEDACVTAVGTAP